MPTRFSVRRERPRRFCSASDGQVPATLALPQASGTAEASQDGFPASASPHAVPPVTVRPVRVAAVEASLEFEPRLPIFSRNSVRDVVEQRWMRLRLDDPPSSRHVRVKLRELRLTLHAVPDLSHPAPTASPDDVHVEVEPFPVDHRPAGARPEQQDRSLVSGVVEARARARSKARVKLEAQAVLRPGVEGEHSVGRPQDVIGGELYEHPPRIGTPPSRREFPRPSPPRLSTLSLV
jgi:hypothetical protein